MLDNSFELNGNMTPDEVLEGMGLEGKTSEQKSRLREHVKQLIDESNVREVPLRLQSVNYFQVVILIILMLHRTHADEQFAQDFEENGLHHAVDNAQGKTYNWKSTSYSRYFG